MQKALKLSFKKYLLKVSASSCWIQDGQLQLLVWSNDEHLIKEKSKEQAWTNNVCASKHEVMCLSHKIKKICF